MKTTIEIADDVLTRAKRQARQEGRTLREVVERALRQHLAVPEEHLPPLTDAIVQATLEGTRR